MRLIAPFLSVLLTASLISAPVFAAATTTPSTPAPTSVFSNFSSQSTSNSNSGGNNNAGSALLLGAITGAALLGSFLIPAAGTAVTVAEGTAAVSVSQAKAGLSFGGRIALVLPCLSLLGPSVWTVIVPAPATKQPLYIWTPATLRGLPPTSPDVPPPYAPLQGILGIADIPYWCCLPPGIPGPPGLCFVPYKPYIVPGLPGQRMQFANQSISPSPPGAVEAALIQGAAASAAASAAATTVDAAAQAAITAAVAATASALLGGAAAAANKH
ncbi:MAG TPA: hypothetical protein VG984_03455 [Candidatus Paceibacterota bacterium]|nr:hypothetical protein [Candidatus Paceibacterota bacterium]